MSAGVCVCVGVCGGVGAFRPLGLKNGLRMRKRGLLFIYPSLLCVCAENTKHVYTLQLYVFLSASAVFLAAGGYLVCALLCVQCAPLFEKADFRSSRGPLRKAALS